MAQKIESEKLFVQKVFQNWYRIPEYQRPYVWETDQVTELLDDVYQANQSNDQSQYFLGSMVLKKNEKTEGTTTYTEYDLLDGQQRLTTLFLLTAVIRDLTPKSNESRLKICKESIFQMAIPDDNVPERMRIVFDIRDKVKSFVNDYVKADGGTLRISDLTKKAQDKEEDISIRNMSNALLTIKAYFENGHSIDEFFKYLRSNVLMIYVAAEELEDAFHLFTVMNNRGIKLRNSDILKAENLAKVADIAKRTEYAKLWESIEEYFAEDFDNFLSHIRTILVKQKAGYNLLKEYEENIYAPKEFDRTNKVYIPKPPLLEKGQKTFDEVKKYYSHYFTLFEGDHYKITNNFEINNMLVLMKYGFEADFWIAPMLKYYSVHGDDGLSTFIIILDRKFSADWLIGLSPTYRIENINAIIKEIENVTDLSTLFKSDVFAINSNELVRTLSGDIYGRKYAKYVLLKIDLAYHGHSTRFTPPEMISIEHILPQTPETGSQWSKDFTDIDRDQWTNRLGNLIFLSRRKNSAQSNFDYDKKRDKYFRNNIELFSNSVRIMQGYPTWKLADLKKNHKETLEKFLGLYGISLQDDELERLMQ
jgi:uncharacterized protein with ParB-like and HNH nuclease domain